MFVRIIEMIENIIIKLIDKMNIVTLMLILVILGIMNKQEVFQWFSVIGKSFKGLLP